MSLIRHAAGVLLFIFIASSSFADGVWAEKLTSQLAEVESLNRHYRYTQTIVDSNGERVSVFDPTQSPQWELLTVNGLAATEREKDKFISDREKRNSRERSPEDMVSSDSVKIIEDGVNQVVLSFTPILEDIPDSKLEFINGVATMDAVSGMLQKLVINNTEPFAPSFAFKINSMNMEFGFQSVGGITLIETSDFTMQAKIAAVRNLDVSAVVTFSDVNRVID